MAHSIADDRAATARNRVAIGIVDEGWRKLAGCTATSNNLDKEEVWGVTGVTLRCLRAKGQQPFHSEDVLTMAAIDEGD